MLEPVESPARLADHDDTRPARGRQHPEETAERTVAEHDDGLPRLDSGPLDRQDRARPGGLGECGPLGGQR
jgi:hypothetical protein